MNNSDFSIDDFINDICDKAIVDIDYYADVRAKNRVFECFIEALERSASLDYTGKSLNFDSSVIDVAFSIILPNTYNETLKRLQVEKAADDEFNKGV